MPVRLNTCSDKVEANVGRVAVTRGPLVYCAEEVDNGGPVQRRLLPDCPERSQIGTAAIAEGPLAGIVAVSLPGAEHAGGSETKPATLHFVPYYAWNNRGEKSMIVWLPRSLTAAVTP